MFEKRITELKKGLEGFAEPPKNFVERLHYLWNNSLNSSFTISEMAKIFSAVFEVKIHPNTIRPFIKEITVHKAYGNEIAINQKNSRFKYYLQKPVTIHTIEHIQKQRSVKANYYKRRRGSTVIPPISPSAHKIQSGTWTNGKWTSSINLNNSPRLVKKKSLPDRIIEQFDPTTRQYDNKKYITNLFLNQSKSYLNNTDDISVVTLTGPDYHGQIAQIIDVFNSKVTVAEIEPKVFDKIYEQAKECPYFKNRLVDLFLGNIEDAGDYGSQYQQLDFCQTVKTVQNIIRKRMTYQSKLNENDLKCFVFLTSCRKVPNTESFAIISDILKDVLGTYIVGYDGLVGSCGSGKQILKNASIHSHINKHIPQIVTPGKLVDLNIFTYKDNSPMIACLVIYK